MSGSLGKNALEGDVVPFSNDFYQRIFLSPYPRLYKKKLYLKYYNSDHEIKKLTL